MAKGVRIGLRNLVYAILDNDPESGGVASYQAPKRVPGIISANLTANASAESLFADDGAYDTAATTGQLQLELNIAEIPLSTVSEWLGSSKSGGILTDKGGDVAPWVAVGFKTLKSNGKYRYVWFLKGKFSVPDESNETKGDAINFQTDTITATFVKRDCDDAWRKRADEDDIDYLPAIGTNWFNDPYAGMSGTTAPLIQSVTPANNATAVAVGSSVVWTFNEALALSTVIPSNFMVAVDSSGASVPGALTINAARTIVTFTPTSALTAATAYRAIVSTGVANLSGIKLAAPSITKFTTA